MQTGLPLPPPSRGSARAGLVPAGAFSEGFAAIGGDESETRVGRALCDLDLEHRLWQERAR